jgi:hypothetical protein
VTDAARRPPYRVAYLAGTSYCGSTILAMLLDSHPRVVSIGEAGLNRRTRREGRTAPPCSCGVALEHCAFWRDIFAAVRGDGFAFGPAEWSNDYRYLNPLVHRLLSQYSSWKAVQLFQRVAEAALPWHRQRVQHAHRVNVSLVRRVLQRAGADVLVDTSKAPMRLHHLLNIPDLEVRLIHLVRDVRAYAEAARRRGRTLAAAVDEWTTLHRGVEAIARRLPAERVLRLRYEDWAADAAHVVPDVHRFIGVPPLAPPPTIDATAHHVLGNRLRMDGELRVTLDQKWRQRLSVGDVMTVLARAGAMHEQFGYSSR